MAENGTYAAVAATIRGRRSNMNVDHEAAIDDATIDELIELARWAPNHFRTNPFKFAVIRGAARGRLGQIAADALAAAGGQPPVVERQRAQFERTPVVLAIAAAPDADAVKQFENRYTVAAGVQNILLAATARGLASAWRSGPAMVDPAVAGPVKAALGFAPDDEIVAYVYLGHQAGPPGNRDLPPALVNRIES